MIVTKLILKSATKFKLLKKPWLFGVKKMLD